MKRLLVGAAIYAFWAAGALAAVRTAVVPGGLWSATGTWVGGVVPLATDQAIIPDGSGVILDAAAACAAGASNCVAATGTDEAIDILAGGSLIVGRGVTVARIDCPVGSATPCVVVAGSLIVAPGSTIKMQPDTAGISADTGDGIQVQGTGRLVVHGQLLTRGVITAVPTDEATITNVHRGFGLPTRDFVFEDARAHFPTTTTGTTTTGLWASGDSCTDNCFVVRFTSGERAGRWYNVQAHDNKSVTVDYDSRSNPACATGGATETTCTDAYGGSYTAGGNAVFATGSATVTCAGCTWLTNLHITVGSRIYCTADGVGAAKRVKRVPSETSITLDETYGSGGCTAAGGAYTILDDNQPWPFEDHSEHIAPGDTYEIFQPATIQGATTAGAEPTGSAGENAVPQSWVACQSGAYCAFDYATLKWLGRNNVYTTLRLGLSIVSPTMKRITNSEFSRGGGVATIFIDSSTGMEIAGNFIHAAHPLIDAEDGHGIIFGNQLTAPGALPLNSNTLVHDNRFDLLNDDGVWVPEVSTGFRFQRNIGKYTPATTLGTTTEACLDLGGPEAVGTLPNGVWLHKDDVASDNICMNAGAADSHAFAGTSGRTGTQVAIGWNNNRIANIQAGSGIVWNSVDITAADYLASSLVAAGNYISHVGIVGITGIHKAFNNEIRSWAISRSGGQFAALAGISERMSGNITIPSDEIAATGYALHPGGFVTGAVDLSLGAHFRYAPGGVTVSDNIFFGHGFGVRTDYLTPIDGNPLVTFSNNWFDCTLDRDTAVPGGDGLYLGNASAAGVQSYVVTNNYFVGCTNGCGLCKDPNPLLTENNNVFIGNIADTNFVKDGTDTDSPMLGVSPRTLAFDSRYDSANTKGPRSVGPAGWAARRATYPAGLGGNSAVNAKDSDGDGISDLFDNCAKAVNPTQLDSDSNGVGDACGG